VILQRIGKWYYNSIRNIVCCNERADYEVPEIEVLILEVVIGDLMVQRLSD
jgi:hypothetical protein